MKTLVRRAHRAISIVFTLMVLLNIAFNIMGVPEELSLGVGMLTLVPLLLLMLSGLYLFALPYLVKRR